MIVREGQGTYKSATNQSSASYNYTLVNGSGNNRLLVVGVSFEEDHVPPRYVTGITFNGVGMTKVTSAPISWGGSIIQYATLYYMLDSELPATGGSYQIVATLDGVVASDEICVYNAEYSDVNQAAPDDDASHTNSSAGATSVTLTPAGAGSLGVLVCGSGGTTSHVGNENNCTTIVSQLATSAAGSLAELLDQSSGFTFGYNNLSTREGVIGAVWRPISTAQPINCHQMIL